MNCPYCHVPTKGQVLDSREHSEWIRRRRRCESCEQNFTTYEIISETRQVGPPTLKFPACRLGTIQGLAMAIVTALEELKEAAEGGTLKPEPTGKEQTK